MLEAGTIDATTLLAGIALVTGAAGALVAILKVGPEKTNTIVTYQAQVLQDLRDEVKRLHELNTQCTLRLADSERRANEEERKRLDLERRLRQLEEAGIRWEQQMGNR